MLPVNQRRSSYLILSSCLLLGALILLYHTTDGPGSSYARNYGGDLVAVGFVYFTLKVLINRPRWQLAVTTYLIAAIIETNQLWWHALAQRSSLATLMIGSNFDWVDLVIYGLGVLVSLAIDRFLLTIR